MGFMTRRKRRAVFIVLIVAVVLPTAWFTGRKIVHRFFYPTPPEMPPVVEQPTEQLLRRLEMVLREHAPAVADTLQPGLTAEQIATLESAAGIQLTDDLRAMYMWRNGMPTDEMRDFIPGHSFPPLEEAIRLRADLIEQAHRESLVQRIAYALFAGHRRSWLVVLDDRAGDGYFYDPERRNVQGCFFYHFAEDGHYVYYPSLRNFLAGVIECFESGVYRGTGTTVHLAEDHERSREIMQRFGASNLPE